MNASEFRARYRAEFGDWFLKGPEEEKYLEDWLAGVPETIADLLFERVQEMRAESRMRPRLGDFKRALAVIRQERGISGPISSIDAVLRYLSQFRSQIAHLVVHKMDPIPFSFRIAMEDDGSPPYRIWYVPEEPWPCMKCEGKRVLGIRIIAIRDWLFDAQRAGRFDDLKTRLHDSVRHLKPNTNGSTITFKEYVSEVLQLPSRGNQIEDAIKAWAGGDLGPIKALEKECHERHFFTSLIKVVTSIDNLRPERPKSMPSHLSDISPSVDVPEEVYCGEF